MGSNHYIPSPPIWWVDGYTDAEWELRLKRIEEFGATFEARPTAYDERRKAWMSLRDTMTTEEADAYIFNLTKLGVRHADLAELLGISLSNVSVRVRRHRQRIRSR